MKKASLMGIAIFLLAVASCSNKNDTEIACSAQYIFPSLNFEIINKSDFTMPVYTTADIKIYLKNEVNRVDTISPDLKDAAGRKYFSFNLKSAKETDTCYIKVKNYKTDTLVYALSNTNAPCPQPYISKITINKAAPLVIAPYDIVQIVK